MAGFGPYDYPPQAPELQSLRDETYEELTYPNLRTVYPPGAPLGNFFVGMSAVFCLATRYSFYRSFLFIYGAAVLFSPVVHPWYVCWLIPFLMFHPNKPWLFFTGWVALSYLIHYLYPDGLWKEVLWLKLLI